MIRAINSNCVELLNHTGAIYTDCAATSVYTRFTITRSLFSDGGSFEVHSLFLPPSSHALVRFKTLCSSPLEYVLLFSGCIGSRGAIVVCNFLTEVQYFVSVVASDDDAFRLGSLTSKVLSAGYTILTSVMVIAFASDSQWLAQGGTVVPTICLIFFPYFSPSHRLRKRILSSCSVRHLHLSPLYGHHPYPL